jgi:hypothetical protein
MFDSSARRPGIVGDLLGFNPGSPHASLAESL